MGLSLSRTAVAGAILLGAAVAARAQALNGSVVGNVKDASDAAVADAIVTLANAQTSQARQITTDQLGSYAFATVSPGAYELRVSKSGFAAFVESNVVVTADNITRIDITLKVGGVTETVTVEANAAALQTDSAEVRHDLGAPELNKLPVPVGRNYQSLLSTVLSRPRGIGQLPDDYQPVLHRLQFVPSRRRARARLASHGSSLARKRCHTCTEHRGDVSVAEDFQVALSADMESDGTERADAGIYCAGRLCGEPADPRNDDWRVGHLESQCRPGARSWRCRPA